MLVIFLALIIGPVVAGPHIGKFSLPGFIENMNLLQPTGQDNNDTTSIPTGGPKNERPANNVRMARLF